MTSGDRRQHVEDACAALLAAGRRITFDDVATGAGLGRATLYRNPELRAIVEEYRVRGTEAHTLTGVTREIAHLRVALDEIAAKVRRHEEELRKLRRTTHRN